MGLLGLSDGVVVAVVGGVFGTIIALVTVTGTIYSAKTNQKLKRRNGSTVGQGADEMVDRLGLVEGRLGTVEQIVAEAALDRVGDRRVQEHILKLLLTQRGGGVDD